MAVRLTPKASRDRVEGLVANADGSMAVKAQVTAVPEDGKANAALIRLLSKEWRLPRSSISLVSGATDRRKVLFISGDVPELSQRLEQWTAGRA